MYNSGYSQVSKFSLEAQKRKMQQRPKGKSCGYYMRIVFFFSSLIQSLIIVSLVLFLVYGKQQDSASTTRIHNQDQSLELLRMERDVLRQQKENLTTSLNVTMTEKMSNDRILTRLRSITNFSFHIITDFNAKLNQYNMELINCKASRPTGCPACPRSVIGDCDCGVQNEQLRAKLELLRSNFTQTTQMMRLEMDQISRERDNINLEAIKLRRDKSLIEEEMARYRAKCKQDFANSLGGISNVSRAFLRKIDSLFPQHIPFQLTCQNQRENLEQIRNNCTSLSREVEDKFQRYLDSVGAKVSQIQAESTRLEVENKRLLEDHRHCNMNRSNMIYEHRQNVQKVQLKCDKEKEKVLMEKKKLTGEKELLQININVKDTEIRNLKDQVKQLNTSCPPKRGLSPFPGLSSGGFGQNMFPRTGSTSSSTSLSLTGTGLNKPGSNAFGSPTRGSAGSSSSLGTIGVGSGKIGLSGVGSSSFQTNGLGSSSLGSNGLGSQTFGITGLFSSGIGKKPGTSGLGFDTGIGSTGVSSTGLSNTRLTGGTGSSSTGLGTWSGAGSSNTGQKLGTSSTGLGNKAPTGTGLGSTGTTGLKIGGFGGLGSLGLGNRGSSPLGTTGSLGWGSNGGTGFGKPEGGGSLFNSGRTGALGGGLNSASVNLYQHLQELQRYANPTASKEKQDPYRTYG